jgi:hypothetical protein
MNGDISMKKIVLTAALIFAANLALAAAGGSQIKEQNPLFDYSGEVVGTVVPVPDACEVVIPQSGKAVYIICDDSDE